MGCCGASSDEETTVSTLFRDLPEDVLAIRRAAFSALRREERLDPEQLALRTGLDYHAVNAALRWLQDAGLVERDRKGRVVGIAGLTLEPTRHDSSSMARACTPGVPSTQSVSLLRCHSTRT
jgi:DNA-binding transcriptional ArsR family regulator